MNAAEIIARRKREAAGEMAAVPAATVEKAGPWTSADVFASRRAAVEKAMAEARAPRGSAIADREPKPGSLNTTASDVLASRQAVIEWARRSSDGGRDA